MDQSLRFVTFSLDEQRYALPLSIVERVVRVVEVTPLPKAPEIVLGVINVQGQVIPVINLRRRNRLPERALQLSDHLILARAAQRTVALVVDAVNGVVECAEREVLPAQQVLPGLEYVSGMVKREDGVMLIQDLDASLSLDEATTLEHALQPAASD